MKEAQPISPPQLLKVTGATAERCLIFFSEGKTQREREKEREGGREGGGGHQQKEHLTYDSCQKPPKR